MRFCETYPDKDKAFPVDHEWFTTMCFLKNIITKPNIIVGDYTYYHDMEDVKNFEKNILYHYDFVGDKLVIGKFCQIGSGVRFIMNGSYHSMNGVSSYPFKSFLGSSWQNVGLTTPYKGDLIIGNDVWVGYNVCFMPGVKVGNGVIIGANSVVTKDIPDYSIIGGNPAKIIRKRFSDEEIAKLLEIKWWDWPIEKITLHADIIANGTVDELRNC